MSWENLIVGIISGVCAPVIIWVVQFIWIKKFLPQIKNFYYKGYLVDGVWEEDYEIEGQLIDKSIIKLKQEGDKVKGTIVITKQLNDEVKKFNCQGKIRGNIISLMTFNINQRQLGAQSYILLIENDGFILKGYKLFYNVFPFDSEKKELADKIQKTEIAWIRKKE